MRPAHLSEFYERTRTAKKVVVVDLGFLGDTLRLVPALWEIKRHYAAELHVVSSPLGAEVLRLAPCVDRAWSVVLDPAQRSLREQWRLVRALRREKFDVAINFGGADRTVILSALTGARWRVAHASGRWHFWNRWLIANWVPRLAPDLTAFEQCRQLLAACGFTLHPPRFDLRVDTASLQWAKATVPEGAIHLSINSANPMKEWPLAHYAAMLKAVWRSEPELRAVVSIGAKLRERERLQQFQAAVNDPRLQLLPASLTIAQLAGALQRCRLHLGPDSGGVHLAMALGVPTLSFFREQKGYKAWLPPGANQQALTAPCACIDHGAAPCEASGQAACLARIEPDQVAKMVCQQFEAGTLRQP
jgi:ADP-heptose:LPS heptosyltransferase